MSDPTYERVIEFHFTDGDVEPLRAEEARMMVTETPEAIRVVVTHEDGAVEDVEVFRRDLRMVKRARIPIQVEAPTLEQVIEAKVAGGTIQ